MALGAFKEDIEAIKKAGENKSSCLVLNPENYSAYKRDASCVRRR